MLTKVPYSGKRGATKDIYSKEEKQAQGFKTVEFGANMIGFMTRIDLIYKTVLP